MELVTYVGTEKMEERHPVLRMSWKTGMDTIQFTRALERVLSISDLSLLGPAAYTLATIDLLVHKNPDMHILCLSSDLCFATSILLEVLEAQTVHRRFRSFSLGRLTADGELVVAEVCRFTVPLDLKSLVFQRASLDLRYELVILPSSSLCPQEPEPWTQPLSNDAVLLSCRQLENFTTQSCRFVYTSTPPRDNFSSGKQFSILSSLPSATSTSIHVIEPLLHTCDAISQKFKDVVLVSFCVSLAKDVPAVWFLLNFDNKPRSAQSLSIPLMLSCVMNSAPPWVFLCSSPYCSALILRRSRQGQR